MSEEKRKIPGEWWLANNPSEKWIGTLKLEHDESPRLEVSIPKGFFKLENQKIPSVIHGNDQHGIPVTLFFVSPPRLEQSAAFTQMKFSAGYAVLGIDFPDVESFQVHTLVIQMQHLFEWGGISGFKRDQPNTLHDIQICYSRPKNQSFTIDSNLTIQLRSAFSSRHNWEGQKIEEDLLIAFESKQEFGLQRGNELIRAIRHLLHFAVLEQVYPISVVANKEGYGESYGDQFIKRDIEIWSSNLRKRVKSEIVPERWIFQLKDIQTNFGTFMAMWLDYLKIFDEALNNYFSTIYHSLPHEIQHLCLTQALDAYHGIKFVSHDERGYEKKIKELVEANQPSLKGLVDDPADFATTVLHNRNYYTHHNPKWKEGGRVLSGSRLYRLNEKLQLIFQMCVLKDIGIPSDRFVQLRRQLATQIIDYP